MRVGDRVVVTRKSMLYKKNVGVGIVSTINEDYKYFYVQFPDANITYSWYMCDVGHYVKLLTDEIILPKELFEI
jgi:hypothetical protein